MKKIMRRTLLIVLVIALVAVAVIFSNPLRRSEEHIRNNILELTPIGTDMDEVIQTINERYEWNGHVSPSGFPADASYKTLVGERSIQVTLGTYTNFFETSVIALWGFDENAQLIDVRVRKDIHGF